MFGVGTMINCLIHYRKLEERLEFFDKQVDGKFDYIIVDNEDQGDIIFDISQETIDKKKKYLKSYSTFGGDIQGIKKQSEKSVAIKQIIAWNMCAEENEKYFIMEDDILFQPESIKTVEEISNSDLEWDMIMFGESCGLGAGEGLRVVSPPMTRGLSAYLIHPNFARKIKSDLTNISIAIDWELNYLTVKYKCRMLWYEPFLFSQGSQGGPFKSSIQDQ